ncbi:MAG: hypothetical protein AAFV37_12615 [Pseudomonadota bacterium]
MQTDEQYDDLTALFAETDEALQNDVFVKQVMQPIRKRVRWRAPLLFGAGGIGVGAAVSQASGLIDVISARTPTVEVTLQPVDVTLYETIMAQPMWVAAAAMIVLSCAAIIAAERA